MQLKYSYRVAWSADANEWIATSPEWRFLSAGGETPEAAVADLAQAIATSCDIFKIEGWDLPQPIYYYEDGVAMTTPKRRRELEAQATALGCTLIAGKDAGYKSGFVVVAPDESKKWLYSLTEVSKFLRTYEWLNGNENEVIA